MSMHTEIKVFLFISYQVFLLGLSFLPILFTEQVLNSLFGTQADFLSSSLCRTELFIGSQMVTILIILIMSPPPSESMPLLCKVFISWCLATLLFHLIFWCYGAPAFESFTCTLHLSSLMASLTVIPFGMVLDANSKRFQKIFLLNRTETGMESTVWYSTWGATVGAWLGAFPIPLDWDRPWQVWPISCIIGALSGYTIGLLTSGIFHFVKIIKSKSKSKFV